MSNLTGDGEASGFRTLSAVTKRRILLVNDNEDELKRLIKLFEDEYLVDTAKDGNTALARLRHGAAGYCVVLLDLSLPGMDGLKVLEKMRESPGLQSVPVIVFSDGGGREATLRAIEHGAVDFIVGPTEPEQLKLRVEAAVSKAENERLRAQNNYLLLQSSEEAKYRTVLDSTGTVVIEYEWVNGVFVYDSSISEHIAGVFDKRRLWHILLSDMVADALDVRAMQELVHSVANERERGDGEMTVRLRTPSGEKQWFRMRVFKRADEYRLTNRLIITYININDEVRREERLRYQAERDALTGLYNRSAFLEHAAKMISNRPAGYYVLGCFDINNFKVINDRYGSEKGDEVLQRVAAVFREGFDEVGGLVSRITADNFAVLYPASFMSSKKLVEIRERAARLDGSTYPVTFSVGRYVVDDLTLSVSAMYDRAVIAERSVKGRVDANIALYDESMRERIIHEQEIANEMNPALEQGQFEVWLQPQYNHSSGALIGAEALARWRHPVKGIIPPGVFIPVFERSGFIYELDKYVWEQSCRLLKGWMDAGRSPLPISVNVSRYDLFREDMIDFLNGLLRKYELPVDLLRLEITESAFSQSTEQIITVVKKLVEQGYTVEIDDFGSGYSSLNTLKSVPAQIVKMDMRFLESDDDSDRGGNILESIVRMSKWLGMSVIAEGVETVEQADFLKSIGCNYVQGFLYARPMPSADYEALVGHIGREEKLLTLETVETLDNNRFWNPTSMDTLIFNTYVGGACIFEWHNGRIDILRANEKYARDIGGEGCTVEDALSLRWEEHMDEAAAKATREAIERAIETGEEVCYEARYHDLFNAGESTWLRTAFRVIAKTADRSLLYATNENLTAQREAELERNKADEQLRAIIDNVGGGLTAVVLRDGTPRFLFANERYFEINGYTREQYEAEVTDIYDLVHPDDRLWVFEATQGANEPGKTTTIEYRLIRRDGSMIWARTVISAHMMEGEDFPVQFSMLSDISAEKNAERQIRALSENLRFSKLSGKEKEEYTLRETLPLILSAIMKASTDLVFAKDVDFRYICCSPAFAKYAGQPDESAVVGKTDYELFDNKELADKYRRDDMRLFEGGQSLIDYREPLPLLDGVPRYAVTSKYILRDSLGNILGLYGVGRDVTEESNAYERLKLLTNSLPCGLASYELSPEGTRITYFSDGYCAMMGYTREEYAEICSTGTMNLTFEEDIPGLVAQLDAMRETGAPLDYTYRIRTKDGGFIRVNCRGSLAERRGELLYINVALINVTEARLAEEAARIHGEELRLAITQVGKMVCEYDPHSRVLTVPEAFAALNDLPSNVIPDVPESILAAGFIDPVYTGVFRAFYESIIRGERQGAAEYREKRADGSWHWARSEFTMVFDSEGRPAKAVIAVDDTTERHRLYELERSRPSLGEANLFVHALFNLTTGETLEYAYSDGSEVPMDDRTALYYGAELLDSLLVDDDERESYRKLNDAAALLEKFNRGETELSMDYRRRAPNGDVIWIRNIKRMVRAPGGEDVLLFDYFYNIEQEKTRELMYALLVNENYEYVARINGATRRFEVVISAEFDDSLIPREGEDFDVIAERVVRARTHPADREAMLKYVSVASIKEKLNAYGRFQFTFRILTPDGETRYKRITQYYLDRQRDIIIFTREDVTAMMRSEMRRNELLEAALNAANEDSRLKERRAAAQLKAIMNNVDGGVSAATLIDGEIGYLFVNDAYYSMFGYTREQFERELPRGLVDIIHPDDLQLVYDMAEKSVQSGTERWEFRVTKRDGGVVWVRSISSTCEIEGIDSPVHIAVLIDMTKEREMADALRMSEEQFRIAATISSRAIARYDVKTGVYHHNDEALFELGFGEQIENVPQAFIDRDCIAEESVEEFLEFYEKLRRGEPSCSIEMQNLMGDGDYHWQRQDATVIFDADGKPSQAILVMCDISETRQKEAAYRELAESDPLTGVLNRIAFSRSVDRIISELGEGETLALMILDIDRFKQVNDTLGHAVGDRVLCDIADALRGVLRQEDLLGRLGGDEFLICLRNMPDEAAIARKAEQICALLNRCVDPGVNISTSIGIAISPRDGISFETLYRHVDPALYAVKARGKNSYAFFDPSMAHDSTET